ncbi:Lin-7 protein [Trichuris trichiura]|uniref:Lin-7 protein n=1 Tax=Trichuris trichiura TaxID=36087 RepID=A0A077YXP4_TRITR|nr:Lin-7 protein [Trichuris trichiura]
MSDNTVNPCIVKGAKQDVGRRPMGSCPANKMMKNGSDYAVGHIFADMFGHEVPFFDTLGLVICVCVYAVKSYRKAGIKLRDTDHPPDFITTTLWNGENVTWMEAWLDPEDYPKSVECHFEKSTGERVSHELALTMDDLEGPCYHDGHEEFALQQCQPSQYCVRQKSNKPVCQLKPIENRTDCDTSIFFPSLCELMKPVSNVSLSAYQEPDEVLPLGTYVKWPVTDSVRFSYYANQEQGKNVYVSLTCLKRGEDRGSTNFEYEERTFQPDETSVASGDVTFHICFDSELFRIGIDTDQGESYYLYGIPFTFDAKMEANGKELLESTPENPIRSVKCKIDIPYMITDLFRVQTWWSLSSTGKDLKTDELNGDEHISSNYRCNVLVKFQSTFPRLDMEEYKHTELRIYLSGLRNVDFNQTVALDRYNKRKPPKDETDKSKVKLGKLRRKRKRREKAKAAAGWAPGLIRKAPGQPSMVEEEISEPLLPGEQLLDDINIDLEDLDFDLSESTETSMSTETGDAGYLIDEEEEGTEELTESGMTEELANQIAQEGEDSTESTENKSAE